MIMKNHSVRITVCALAIAASMAMLTGCGGKKVSEGYWQLKQISEGKETVKGDDLEEYGLEEAYIVTEKSGEGYAVLFGIPVNFEVNEDKGNFEFSTGKVDYKVSGKKLTLADSNVTMVFEKSKDDAPAKPAEVALAGYSQGGGSSDDIPANLDFDWGTGEEDDTEKTDDKWDFGVEEDENTSDGPYKLSYSNPREYFEGDWYGWMTISARTDFWKEIDGEVYDAMCKVEMDDDTFGTLTIFDAGMPYEKPIARMPIIVAEDGVNPKIGRIQSDDGGFFLDGKVGNTTWESDPGATDWKNYMMIAATYVDGNEVEAMDYVFHFKKWGDDWSDFSQKPPHYDWYKKLIDKGEPMPAAPPED
jgi:hypothetical protein